MEHKAIHLKTSKNFFMMTIILRWKKDADFVLCCADVRNEAEEQRINANNCLGLEIFRYVCITLQEKRIGTRLDVLSSLCLLRQPNGRCIRFIWICDESPPKKGGSVAFVSAQSGNEIITRS